MFAQGNNQQTFKLSGSVVNAVSGEPVRGALVQLSGMQPKSVLAGSDGRFEIEGVNAGTVFVNAQRPGFTPDPHQQPIVVGSATDSVTVKLLPLAKISGRIVDRDGEPIDGVAVQCLHETIFNGRKQWQQSNGANTDESGRFLIDDLNPGAYILFTREAPLYLATPAKSEAARFLYPRTFYPDSISRDTAQRIVVGPGEDFKVDMALHSMRGSRITMTTEPRLANVMAMIEDPEEAAGGRGAQLQNDGAMTFGAVPPGSWKIVVRGPFNGHGKENDEALYGELPLEVGSADIDNLKVSMNKLADIPIVVAGGLSSGIYVQLISKNGPMTGSESDQSGAMRIPAVIPGSYRITLQPKDYCVASMASGPVDLLRDELVVATGGSVAPIQIAKGGNCGSLTVSVKTAAPAIAIITSDAKAFEPKVVMASEQGSTISGLHEGEYKVYAFDDISDLEYANPEALREFSGQAVKLEAGQKASMQVDVISRRAR